MVGTLGQSVATTVIKQTRLVAPDEKVSVGSEDAHRNPSVLGTRTAFGPGISPFHPACPPTSASPDAHQQETIKLISRKIPQPQHT
jgi:hypothetical protein